MAFSAPRDANGMPCASTVVGQSIEFAPFRPRVQRVLKGWRAGEAVTTASLDLTGDARPSFRPSTANPTRASINGTIAEANAAIKASVAPRVVESPRRSQPTQSQQPQYQASTYSNDDTSQSERTTSPALSHVSSRASSSSSLAPTSTSARASALGFLATSDTAWNGPSLTPDLHDSHRLSIMRDQILAQARAASAPPSTFGPEFFGLNLTEENVRLAQQQLAHHEHQQKLNSQMQQSMVKSPMAASSPTLPGGQVFNFELNDKTENAMSTPALPTAAATLGNTQDLNSLIDQQLFVPANSAVAAMTNNHAPPPSAPPPAVSSVTAVSTSHAAKPRPSTAGGIPRPAPAVQAAPRPRAARPESASIRASNKARENIITPASDIMLFEDDGSDDDLRASRQSHVKGNTRVRPATAKPSVPAPQLSQSPTHRARKHQPVPVSAQSTQQSQSLPQQNSSVDESDPLQSAARVLASVQRSSVRNSVTTIPQPFTFLARDNPQAEHKKETIEQAKFKKWMAEKKAAEERELNYQFRAKPIPAAVLVPRLDHMKRAEEARRADVRAHAKETLLATQRPFELSQPRAASPNKAEEIVSPRFTARDIPAEVLKASDPEFAKKQERERQERIKARAAQLSAESSLPARMAVEVAASARESQSKLEALRQKWEKDMTFTPQISLEVPDFKSLHEDFHNRLLAKKSAFQPTVPQDFAAARPSVKKQQAEEEKKKQEAQQEKEKQEKEKNKTKENTLRLSSSLTESKLFQVGELTQLNAAAAKAKREQRKAEKEAAEKREKEERKRAEAAAAKVAQEKKDAEEKMRADVRARVAAAHTKEADDREAKIKERVAELRRQRKAEEEAWKNKIAEINARAQARPLLIEHDAQEKAKIRAKRKALATVKEQLQASGVDFRTFFEPAELHELEQLEIEEQIEKQLGSTVKV